MIGTAPVGYIMSITKAVSRNPADMLYDISSYQIFGMQSEIQRVIDSITKLNEEIRELKYLEIDDIPSLDELRYIQKEVNEFFKMFDDSISKVPN
jgi:hypothetical protein